MCRLWIMFPVTYGPMLGQQSTGYPWDLVIARRDGNPCKERVMLRYDKGQGFTSSCWQRIFVKSFNVLVFCDEICALWWCELWNVLTVSCVYLADVQQVQMKNFFNIFFFFSAKAASCSSRTLRPPNCLCRTNFAMESPTSGGPEMGREQVLIRRTWWSSPERKSTF